MDVQTIQEKFEELTSIPDGARTNRLPHCAEAKSDSVQ